MSGDSRVLCEAIVISAFVVELHTVLLVFDDMEVNLN